MLLAQYVLKTNCEPEYDLRQVETRSCVWKDIDFISVNTYAYLAFSAIVCRPVFTTVWQSSFVAFMYDK